MAEGKDSGFGFRIRPLGTGATAGPTPAPAAGPAPKPAPPPTPPQQRPAARPAGGARAAVGAEAHAGSRFPSAQSALAWLGAAAGRLYERAAGGTARGG